MKLHFYFDRCVPERLCRIIDAYEGVHDVVYLDDEFDPETPDPEWINELSRKAERVAVITADTHIRHNEAERAALAESGLYIYFLHRQWNKLDFHTRAVNLLRIWPRIVESAILTREPSMFEVPATARKIHNLGRTRYRTK